MKMHLLHRSAMNCCLRLRNHMENLQDSVFYPCSQIRSLNKCPDLPVAVVRMGMVVCVVMYMMRLLFRKNHIKIHCPDLIFLRFCNLDLIPIQMQLLQFLY